MHNLCWIFLLYRAFKLLQRLISLIGTFFVFICFIFAAESKLVFSFAYYVQIILKVSGFHLFLFTYVSKDRQFLLWKIKTSHPHLLLLFPRYKHDFNVVCYVYPYRKYLIAIPSVYKHLCHTLCFFILIV